MPARRFYLVVGGVALAASVGLWWHAWSGGPSTTMTCDCTDAGRAVWYLGWVPFALGHGHALWHSDWQFATHGFNLLTDTSILGIGVPMAPVTAIFGPVVSFNVASTLAPAATTVSMAWFLRRRVGHDGAVALGAFAYGFAPFTVVQLAYGWLNLASLALLPLMAACVDELCFRGARRPVAAGAALGGLLAIEFFVSAELALVAAVAIGSAGCVAGIAAMARWNRPVGGWRPAALGAGAAVAVAAVLLAGPVWYFTAGPGHLAGTVWSTAVPGALGNTPGNFWRAVGQWGALDSRQLASLAATAGGYPGPALPSPSYLGPGILAVIAAGGLWRRHDGRLWAFGSIGLAAAVLSLRSGPWALVAHLPVLDNVVQARFAAVIDLCAAGVVAVVAEQAALALEGRTGRTEREGRTGRTGRTGPRTVRRSRLGWAAVAGVGIVALCPVGATLAPNIPVAMQPVVVPTWFTGPGSHVPAGQVLLTYPFATADSQAAVPWQALARMRYRMAGGGGPTGTPARAGSEEAGFIVLRAASVPSLAPPDPTAGNLAAVRRALGAWHVTLTVVPDDTGLPVWARARGTAYGVAFFTAVFGTPPHRAVGAWTWSDPAGAPPPHPVAPERLASCAAGRGPAQAGAVARCVLAAAP